VSANHPPGVQPAPVPATVDSLPELMQAIRARTPARILVGSAGPGYRTSTLLELRQDHAAAVDAVHAELDPVRDFGEDFSRCWNLFEVSTCAASKSEFLLRPDLGRLLTEPARQHVLKNCPAGADLQVVIGDGLSALAVIAQVPALLPMLAEGAKRKGWTFGRTFFIRHCRVGVLNEVGNLLRPEVVVLLIGERPGLATAESLSAYMAYRPQTGHTDAERNLISNIHARGVAPSEAALRILALAEKMRLLQTSGVAVKEDLPGANASDQIAAIENR
jgi:ethanolamine ammonia-lyase small subunit